MTCTYRIEAFKGAEWVAMGLPFTTCDAAVARAQEAEGAVRVAGRHEYGPGDAPIVREFTVQHSGPFAGWTVAENDTFATMVCGDTTQVNQAPLYEMGAADSICRRLPSGWYSDAYQLDTIAGFVFEAETDNERLDSDDSEETDGPYYAAARLSDSDCWWALTEAYDSPSDAAYAADSLAEHLAERDREYSEAYHAGAAARIALVEANDSRREAIKIRRALACENPGPHTTTLCMARAEQLEAEGEEGRQKAFDMIGERPATHPALAAARRSARGAYAPGFDKRLQAMAEAWAEGYDGAA